MRKFLLLLSLFVLIFTMGPAAAASDSYVSMDKCYTNPDNTIMVDAANYNDSINLILNLRNTGQTNATSVKVNDTINPAQLQYDTTRTVQYFDGVSWSTTPLNGNTITVNTTQINWNLGKLPAGANYKVLIPYIIKASGTTITNTATETQTNKNANPQATKSGSLWTVKSNTATLYVQKACNLSLAKKFTDSDLNVKTSTYYGDDNLYSVLTVTNTGPDAANWVVAEDLINPLLWNIDLSKIQTSYDTGTTWTLNDSNVYMLGNYLSWIVSPTKVSQLEILIPALRKPALLNAGATAMIKIPLNPKVTGTPAILGTNLAGIVSNDETYSHNIGTNTQLTGYSEITIQRTADLSIVKSVNNNTPESGDIITFTLTATNNENINWTGNLVKAKVTDTLNPEYFKLINITFKNNNNPTKPYQNNYTYDKTTGELIWTISNLDNNAWTEALVTVQILKDTSTTAAVENTATITGWWQNTLSLNNYTIHDLNPTNNQSTITININHTTTTPLTIQSTTPAEGTDYGLTQPIYINFNNTVSLTGTGQVLIKNLTTGANISAPIVTVTGSQLKIQFTKSRLNNNTYQITIPTELVTDQYEQENAATTLTFTAKT